MKNIVSLKNYKEDKEDLKTFEDHGSPAHPFHPDDNREEENRCRLCSLPFKAPVHKDSPFGE